MKITKKNCEFFLGEAKIPFITDADLAFVGVPIDKELTQEQARWAMLLCIRRLEAKKGDAAFRKETEADVIKGFTASTLRHIAGKHGEVQRIREALTEILEYPEERASYAIAEKALEGGV